MSDKDDELLGRTTAEGQGEDGLQPGAPAGQKADSPDGSHNETERGAGKIALAGGAAAKAGALADPFEVKDEDLADVREAYDGQIRTVEDFMSRAKRPETKEERQQRERRERGKKVISALTDGLSALGNVFFTSQYAPSQKFSGSTLSGALKERLDKARAQREKEDEIYYNYALKRDALKGQKAAALQKARHEKIKELIAKKKAENEEEKHGWERDLQPDIKREQTNKADKEGHLSDKAANDATAAEYNADVAKTKAEYAPKQEEANLNKTKAQTDQAKAAAESSRASAENSRASANEHRARTSKINREIGEPPHAYDENGKKHKFKDWRTAEKFARRKGTWEEYDIETVTDSETNGRTITTKKDGYPINPKEKKGKTMPGVKGKTMPGVKKVTKNNYG